MEALKTRGGFWRLEGFWEEAAGRPPGRCKGLQKLKIEKTEPLGGPGPAGGLDPQEKPREASEELTWLERVLLCKQRC